MERILISQVKGKIGERVKIAGFLQTVRDQGSIKFLIMRDISGVIQAVILKNNEEAAETLKTINLESVIEILGVSKEEKQAPGGIEIEVEKISVLSLAAPELPIPVLQKGSGEESEINKRLDWRFIDLRKPEKFLIFKVWTLFEQSFREYFVNNEFIEIHSPKLMGSPSESGAEVFEVKYFGRKAYLAQSPQFYKQMGMAAGFEKVFEIGPVFRAEPSFTSRHATEFTGYDVEMSYIDSHEDIMSCEEKALNHGLSKIEEKFGKEIKEFYGRDLMAPKIPFPRITMKEAKEILAGLGVESEKNGDLNPEEEKRLSEFIKEKENHEFIFVAEYPSSARPFYHMRLENDNNITKSFDLLWNGLEITTGAQREHRYDVLLKQAEEKGLSGESLQFYLNFFKYGCPPHGGFGLGPERMLMKIFNIGNVREVSFLYRGVNRLEP